MVEHPFLHAQSSVSLKVCMPPAPASALYMLINVSPGEYWLGIWSGLLLSALTDGWSQWQWTFHHRIQRDAPIQTFLLTLFIHRSIISCITPTVNRTAFHSYLVSKSRWSHVLLTWLNDSESERGQSNSTRHQEIMTWCNVMLNVGYLSPSYNNWHREARQFIDKRKPFCSKTAGNGASEWLQRAKSIVQCVEMWSTVLVPIQANYWCRYWELLTDLDAKSVLPTGVTVCTTPGPFTEIACF